METGKGVLWGGAFWGRFSLPPYPQNVDFVWKKPYPPTVPLKKGGKNMLPYPTYPRNCVGPCQISNIRRIIVYLISLARVISLWRKHSPCSHYCVLSLIPTRIKVTF